MPSTGLIAMLLPMLVGAVSGIAGAAYMVGGYEADIRHLKESFVDVRSDLHEVRSDIKELLRVRR
jgi:hypothetical protein